MICSGSVSGIDVSTGSAIDIAFDRAITSVAARQPADTDLFIAPGFIDLQVNGFAGVDYNSPATPFDEIGRSIRVQFASGMTRFYPTVITGPPAEMLGALRNLSRAKDELAEGAAIEGFHVEGPHICPEEGPRGAHPLRWVRPPDIDEYRRWQDATQGRIRLVTLSPHWPDATRYIEAIASDGVTVSIGHTNATERQISEAASAGASMSTHLGNGAHQMLRRHP
ncbi:MAG: N-acetylglucosamine-6-phosphate deacetylase, partial [Acidobacteriota bacterium]|nr:N-acetylglucosamine-6-phosphate deacetylase [Acidobacteriota bacterium]